MRVAVMVGRRPLDGSHPSRAAQQESAYNREGGPQAPLSAMSGIAMLACDPAAIQGAVYRVALSLDALLLNGLQYGVLQPVPADSFLQGLAGGLVSDALNLEEQVQRSHDGDAEQVAEALRADVERLTSQVTALASFRSQALPHVRSAVAQVLRLREECVREIQELERCLRTPKPFYPTRPPHSAAAVDDFLATLDRAFVQEWSASAGG